jgi:hypothetical protein
MASRWTEAEDELLRQLIPQFGRQWSAIASRIPNRNATQVASRWEKCINPILTKGQFTTEEDQLIVDFVTQNGDRAWPKITAVLPHRTTKQCRERWFNNLDPSVSKGPWTPEEDRMIFDAHARFGPKWSQIAQLIPGRSDNAIKNRWNASISKRTTVADNGQPELLTSKLRKYTRRMEPRPRPPPLVAPEPAVSVSLVTPLPCSPSALFGGHGFADEMRDFDGFDCPKLTTPSQSPAFGSGISLFSPTGFGFEF